MHGKDEILSRIAELENISPADAGELFAALRDAVEAFFVPEGNMDEVVAETIQHLGIGLMERETEYEHHELLPPFPPVGNLPGYNDVTELLDAGGVWEEILAVDNDAFIEKFQYVTPEAGEESGGSEEEAVPLLVHPMMEEWTARIPAEREKVLPALERISDFCGSSTLNYGIAQMFEDLGIRTKTPDRTETAERVYISGGFKALIETFALDVHVPSCLK